MRSQKLSKAEKDEVRLNKLKLKKLFKTDINKVLEIIRSRSTPIRKNNG